MRVRFLRDCLPMGATDHEYYRRGAVADLRSAETLIELGYAEAVEAPVPPHKPVMPTSTIEAETPQELPVPKVTQATEAESKAKPKRALRRRKGGL